MTSEDLFREMCKLDADIPFCYDPKIYSIRWLSENLEQSRYMVRKWMKELEADELVRRTHDGGKMDDEPWVWCYHGWSITNKARGTEYYKKCYKDACEEFESFMQEVSENGN